jgi:hypothetical protein
MKNPIPVRACGVVLALASGLGACGGGDEDPAAASGTESTESATSQATSADPSPTETGAPPPDDGRPFGRRCDDVFPARGDGSIADAADEPVTLLLMTVDQMRYFSGLFTPFIDRERNLVLEQKDVTIFVPRTAGFRELSFNERKGILADERYRRQVAERHVVPGRLAPSDLAGDHTTVGGETISVEVDGEDVRISSEDAYLDASVVCGNVPTLDATVYVIDAPLLHVWMGRT